MKEPPRTFEDLIAWQKARRLVNQVYSLSRAERVSRDFGLRDQLQRAAVSVMSNIAEAFERSHLQEKLQFYNMSRASLGEVRSLLYVVEDNYQEQAEAAARLRGEMAEPGRCLSGLIASTKARRLVLPCLLSTLAFIATLTYYALLPNS